MYEHKQTSDAAIEAVATAYEAFAAFAGSKIGGATREQIQKLALRTRVPATTIADSWMGKIPATDDNVLEVLERLGSSKVTTYQGIADALGNPGAANRVGQAVGKMRGIPGLGARVLKTKWRGKGADNTDPEAIAFKVPTNDPSFVVYDETDPEGERTYPASDPRSTRRYWLKREGVPFTVYGEFLLIPTSAVQDPLV